MFLKEIEKHSYSSFHGDVITTTPDKLMRLWDAAGLDYYSGNEGDAKTNFDFGGQIEYGYGGETETIVFYLYDWKYYRPLAIHDQAEFHIGAVNRYQSVIVQEKINELLAEM